MNTRMPSTTRFVNQNLRFMFRQSHAATHTAVDNGLPLAKSGYVAQHTLCAEEGHDLPVSEILDHRESDQDHQVPHAGIASQRHLMILIAFAVIENFGY